MSTATITHNTPLARPVISRFFWKEYRMLRGFWLAVGVLAVAVQLVLPLLAFNSNHTPDMLLAIAWGAAALYAVGATITLFSAEREEQTRDFLLILPRHWLPMFVGKVLLAVLSSVLLALVLSVVGWWIAGFRWPTSTVVHEILSVAGVVIVEATVWGLLFSLWMKQPLLAAILSMAAASFGAQLAVTSTSRFSHAFTTDAYSQAAPMRLLICLGVFLIDVWLASRWLRTPSGTAVGLLKQKSLLTTRPRLAKAAIANINASKRMSRRRMLTRLLWQTWQESWKTVLAAVPIALLLIVAIASAAWLSNHTEIAWVTCPLVLPALLGALVFRADQRSGHRQFLLAHAGRPRYVWLARHLVWLAVLILLGVILQAVGVLLGTLGLAEIFEQTLRYGAYSNPYHSSAWSAAWQVELGGLMFWNVSTLVWSALLAAYGLGQLCSMLLRREVLAGFLALVFATVLTAWAIVIGAWQLSAIAYVLSIAVVSLAATWVRAPNWIVGRNGMKSWLVPLLVLVAPLGLIFATIPSARIAQLEQPFWNGRNPYLQEPLELSLHDWETNRVEARATATAYERLFATLVPWEEATQDVEVEGQRIEDLEFLPHYTQMGQMGAEYGIAANLLTTEQSALLKQFDRAQHRAFAAANQKAIAKLEPLSRRPHAEISWTAEVGTQHPQGIHEEFVELLLDDADRLANENQLGVAADRLLCAVRLRGQGFQRLTTQEFIEAWKWHERHNLLNLALLQWAQHPDQTSQNLKDTILALQEIYDGYPQMREAVLADHLKIREVLLEQQPAAFFEDEYHRWTDYLPFLANKMSWEQQRALHALHLISEMRLNYLDCAESMLGSREVQRSRYGAKISFGKFMHDPESLSDEIVNESVYRDDWRAYRAAQELHWKCRSSYLMADEMSRRFSNGRFLNAAIGAEVARRGLLLQMALLAYRLDHEQYPDSLSALVPDYVAELPLDPYSQQPFNYHPAGLELPLRQFHVAAGTPMFWSVGLNNFELRQKYVVDKNAEWKSPNEEWTEEHVGELVYWFDSTEYYWGHTYNWVFQLPKL